jgi:hypothetical protein
MNGGDWKITLQMIVCLKHQKIVSSIVVDNISTIYKKKKNQTGKRVIRPFKNKNLAKQA